MTQWFRWHRGTVEDGKFRMVARNAGVTLRDVIALWALLLEDAADDEHRGVCTRDCSFMAAVLDMEEEDCGALIEGMELAGLLSTEPGKVIISHWSKRQYETDTKDSTGAERQRRWRETQKEKLQNGIKTESKRQRNGSVTAARRPETETEADSLSFSSLPLSEDSLKVVKEERSEIVALEGGGLAETAKLADRALCFHKFWQLYPHKIGRADAVRVFEKVMKTGRVTFDDLMAGLNRYVNKTDDRPWCNPATWLNQERWEDQPAAPVLPQARTVRDLQKEETRDVIRQLTDYPSRDFGADDEGGGGEDGGPPVGFLSVVKSG